MHSGLEKKHIQGHLLAFSAAAPVVTIATYFILQAVCDHTSAFVDDLHLHSLVFREHFLLTLRSPVLSNSTPLD